jgi:hypothetical protein
MYLKNKKLPFFYNSLDAKQKHDALYICLVKQKNGENTVYGNESVCHMAYKFFIQFTVQRNYKLKYPHDTITSVIEYPFYNLQYYSNLDKKLTNINRKSYEKVSGRSMFVDQNQTVESVRIPSFNFLKSINQKPIVVADVAVFKNGKLLEVWEIKKTSGMTIVKEEFYRKYINTVYEIDVCSLDIINGSIPVDRLYDICKNSTIVTIANPSTVQPDIINYFITHQDKLKFPRHEIQPTPRQEIQPTPRHEIQPTPLHEIQPTPLHEIQPTPLHEIQPTPRQVLANKIVQDTLKMDSDGLQSKHCSKLQFLYKKGVELMDRCSSGQSLRTILTPEDAKLSTSYKYILLVKTINSIHNVLGEGFLVHCPVGWNKLKPLFTETFNPHVKGVNNSLTTSFFTNMG